MLNKSQRAYAENIVKQLQRRQDIPQYPHCDQKVLHGPGQCKYCDAHPDWQELRHVWGINYTGEHDPEKEPCPAERSRPLNIINKWGGNVSTEHVIQEET